jgi:hypothetical protein
MGHPARPEIEKFANEAFAVARDRILREHANRRNEALSQARLTGNSGSYMPALLRWGAERVREIILARADADVDAFTLHGVPSDTWAEADLRTAAQQIAAGAVSAIQGEIDLQNRRTRRHGDYSGGCLNRQIEAAMKSALREGVLRLRRQRIAAGKSLRSGLEPSLDRPVAPASGENQTKPSDAWEGTDIVGLMGGIEKWRMTAGEDGGKLTQKQVAAQMKLHLRAYLAAKKGEPRAKDHLGRIRKFAKDRGISL